MTLVVRPLTLRQANAFIVQHHRHHRPSRGCKFAVCVKDGEGVIRGVATAGRPVARGSDDGLTLEINRCCTDGTKNACSALYAACRRAAQAMGYCKVITYTLPAEGGASLRAAGFIVGDTTDGGSWTCKSRPRIDKAPINPKLRWESD